MRPNLLSVLLVASLAACASQPKLALDAAPLAQPAPELRELDAFLGTWVGTSEVVPSDPEQTAKLLAEMMPTIEGELPTRLQGGSKASWVLGGMFLKTESWHDMGNGAKVRYVDFKTWDPAQRKYRSWYFSELGETGESWFTLDPDGSTFHVTAAGTRPDGSPATGGGSITFTSEDTMEWTWFEDGQHGKLELRGTNTRK